MRLGIAHGWRRADAAREVGVGVEPLAANGVVPRLLRGKRERRQLAEQRGDRKERQQRHSLPQVRTAAAVERHLGDGQVK